MTIIDHDHNTKNKKNIFFVFTMFIGENVTETCQHSRGILYVTNLPCCFLDSLVITCLSYFCRAGCFIGITFAIGVLLAILESMNVCFCVFCFSPSLF